MITQRNVGHADYGVQKLIACWTCVYLENIGVFFCLLKSTTQQAHVFMWMMMVEMVTVIIRRDGSGDGDGDDDDTNKTTMW